MTNMDYIISDYPFAEPDISSNYPFTTKNVAILDSNISYIDEGKGNPILFLHGIPAWNYTWRNIIPTLAKQGRCIAPDLIGLGCSGKPDNIEYTLFDHIRYIEDFINTLGLKQVTLVMHAWGSVVGFDYARRNAHNVKAMAFAEAHLRPITDWNMLSLPIQELASVRQTTDQGYHAIVNDNYYVNTVLSNSILRRLSAEEMKNYRAPFTLPGSTKPLWQYCQEFPLGGASTPVTEVIADYSDWLQQTTIPKLMMYSIPGYLTTIDTIQWARANLPNINLVDVGDGLHYPQEENPDIFTEQLGLWLNELNAQVSLANNREPVFK